VVGLPDLDNEQKQCPTVSQAESPRHQIWEECQIPRYYIALYEYRGTNALST